jgi:hypothetical protein
VSSTTPHAAGELWISTDACESTKSTGGELAAIYESAVRVAASLIRSPRVDVYRSVLEDRAQGMTIPPAQSSAEALMELLQLVRSSEALASLLGDSSRQVIRWLIGKDPMPPEVAQAAARLLAMPSDDLARALHITREELEMRQRIRQSA